MMLLTMMQLTTNHHIIIIIVIIIIIIIITTIIIIIIIIKTGKGLTIIDMLIRRTTFIFMTLTSLSVALPALFAHALTTFLW